MSFIPLSLPPGFQERFNAKIDRSSSAGCWEWTATKTHNGYGRVGLNGKVLLAHRVSYMMHKGDIPAHLHVCHTCDNRKCVNPDHLWLGTRQENMDDCVRKGRARGPNYRGSKIGTSKLIEEEVLQIKEALIHGISSADLGRRFGVTPSTISQIKRGKNWFHLRAA